MVRAFERQAPGLKKVQLLENVEEEPADLLERRVVAQLNRDKRADGARSRARKRGFNSAIAAAARRVGAPRRAGERTRSGRAPRPRAA